MSRQSVGTFTARIVAILELNIPAGTPIYMGSSNTAHMQQSHPADYAQYGSDIRQILNAPDYVGINTGDGSIEFVKEYQTGTDYVKVAVRVSAGGAYYARSIYKLNAGRVANFIRKGTLIKT